MQWVRDLFGVEKPIIAMLHLEALPGDPGYDSSAGVTRIVSRAKRELAGLQTGGVDAVMISNEFSLPYLTKTEPITAITMARIIGELSSELEVPFGVNVLWDGTATLDLAAATGAKFVREIYTGIYASDFGLWNTNVGAAARHRRYLGATGVRLLFNIVPEGAKYLGDRDIASVTRSTVFNAKPDVLLVSGLTAGASADGSILQTVKDNASEVPIFVNTGVRVENIRKQLSIADGAVVGTTFKRDGKFENEVDQTRVEALMQAAREARAENATV